MQLLRYCLALLTVSLFLLLSACTTAKPIVVTPPPQPQTSPPPLPRWLGAKAQVAIIDFEDRTGKRVNRRRSLLGRGMEEQLVTALRQTGQFTILEPPVKTIRNRRGNPITARVGGIDEPEFFIAGSITLYQLSPASIAAGVDADPLLGTSHPTAENFSTTTAQRTFENLAPNERDRIQITLRLLDGRTAQLIDETQITTTAKDFSLDMDGIFSAELLQVPVPTDPATQRAVRASIIRAVNWIGETCQAYRKQQAQEAAQGAVPAPTENSH